MILSCKLCINILLEPVKADTKRTLVVQMSDVYSYL